VLIARTDPSHPDAPNLTKALEKMKEVTEHINRSVQQAENIRKLMQASSKGAGFRVCPQPFIPSFWFPYFCWWTLSLYLFRSPCDLLFSGCKDHERSFKESR
jgi:hypothetical protein